MFFLKAESFVFVFLVSEYLAFLLLAENPSSILVLILVLVPVFVYDLEILQVFVLLVVPIWDGYGKIHIFLHILPSQ